MGVLIQEREGKKEHTVRFLYCGGWHSKDDPIADYAGKSGA
jgi:hypothetical protein